MTAAAPSRSHPPGRRLRQLLLVAGLAGAAALAGCGGGGDIVVTAPLDLRVGVVAGPVAYEPVRTGQFLDVIAQVGQPVVLDASEPVVWSFSVNGSPLFLNGATVDIGGVFVTQVQLTASRAELSSGFHGPALLPVEVWMTATSSIDAAEVVTVRLLLQ